MGKRTKYVLSPSGELLRVSRPPDRSGYAAGGILAAGPAGQPAGDPWTPAALTPDPFIWLKADAGQTESGGVVSRWTSQGSCPDYFHNNNGAFHPTRGVAALNGYNTVIFDGTDDHLLGSASTTPENRALSNNAPAIWVAAVYKKTALDAGAAFRCLMMVTRPDGFTRMAVQVGRTTGATDAPALVVRRLDAEAAGVAISTVSPGTSWCTCFWYADVTNGDGIVRLNGVQTGVNTSLTVTDGNFPATDSGYNISLGDSSTGNGEEFFSDVHLLEVIASNTRPSLADIQKIEGYLAHKGGIQSSLDAAHPYVEFYPVV